MPSVIYRYIKLSAVHGGRAVARAGVIERCARSNIAVVTPRCRSALDALCYAICGSAPRAQRSAAARVAAVCERAMMILSDMRYYAYKIAERDGRYAIYDTALWCAIDVCEFMRQRSSAI